jgi:predicted Zn-dependent protease
MTKLLEQDYQRLAEWGYGCYQQGDLRRARILFSALLELRENDSYAARGLAAVALQEGEPEEALQLMRRLVERMPSDLAARVRLAEALVDAGHLPEAQRVIAELDSRIDATTRMRLQMRMRHAFAERATSF